MADDGSGIRGHQVVSHEEWNSARTAFLEKEKEFTRLRDDLNRQRRALPWELVSKQYRFEGPSGSETLAELFDKRSQLVMYHFMFGPEWDEGCPHCSFWADHYDGMGIHLNHRDVTFVVSSLAPLAKIEAFRKRMGWSFKWVSTFQSDFNFDYHVSFTEEEVARGKAFYNYANAKIDEQEYQGLSVFYKDERGAIFHTYSCYARGIDMLNGTYQFLDLVPKGRDEGDSPQDWVRHHDRYEA